MPYRPFKQALACYRFHGNPSTQSALVDSFRACIYLRFNRSKCSLMVPKCSFLDFSPRIAIIVADHGLMKSIVRSVII
jgi:hypothetical protein